MNEVEEVAMSLSVPELTKTTTTRRRRVTTSTSTSPAVPSTVTAPRPELTTSFEHLANERPSVHTGHIFQALLGIAACLALTGVISQARAVPAGSPDAPAPAVFVQTD